MNQYWIIIRPELGIIFSNCTPIIFYFLCPSWKINSAFFHPRKCAHFFTLTQTGKEKQTVLERHTTLSSLIFTLSYLQSNQGSHHASSKLFSSLLDHFYIYMAVGHDTEYLGWLLFRKFTMPFPTSLFLKCIFVYVTRLLKMCQWHCHLIQI